ncbi:MAG: polymer-forming cytoskeletal protein [Deltaproteobacteria bacterium]|nr:polymer-forming cytoskeletal protein [Deltaproteobacteria bacterium]MBW2361859.1 polymer-forming cytoskeletal protein [Deltaproteobacteria bacterium]
MALKSFGRGGSEDGSAPRASSPPTSSGSASGGLTAFIDQGSEFEGKLSFKDTVRIDGSFRGEIASENTLIVGESGVIEACIRSQTIVISGTVDGDVIATTKVMLHKTGRVNGNIQTPSLVMEEGAWVNGQVKMDCASNAKSGSNLKAIGGGSSKNDDAKGDHAKES